MISLETVSLPTPTPSELRILNCLWENGSLTVREVHHRVDQDNSLSYTTILKQMQIMHAKGLVERDDSQRAHVYSAVGDRDETQRVMLNDFMNRVYKGSASQLVLQALGISKPASSSELDEIDRLIQKLRNNPGSEAERGE